MQLVDGPAHGQLTLADNGSFSYQPDADYNGVDAFSYRIVDGEGHVSNLASVSLTVRPVNDAPVAPAGGTVNVAAGQPHVFDSLGGASDAEGTALTVQWVVTPGHGTLTANGDGSYTFTPDADYNGNRNLSWRVSDGELSSGRR